MVVLNKLNSQVNLILSPSQLILFLSFSVMFLLQVDTKSATFRARFNSIWVCFRLLNSKVNQILSQTQLSLFQVSYGKFSRRSSLLNSEVSKTLSPVQTQLTLYVRYTLFWKLRFPKLKVN